jgi:hypothetical protein
MCHFRLQCKSAQILRAGTIAIRSLFAVCQTGMTGKVLGEWRMANGEWRMPNAES